MTLLGSVKLDETGVPAWPQASIATHLRTKSVKSWPNNPNRLEMFGMPMASQRGVSGFQNSMRPWPADCILELNRAILVVLPTFFFSPLSCPKILPKTFKLLRVRVLMPTKATIGVHQEHVLGYLADFQMGTRSKVKDAKVPVDPMVTKGPTVEQRTSSVRPNLGIRHGNMM